MNGVNPRSGLTESDWSLRSRSPCRTHAGCAHFAGIIYAGYNKLAVLEISASYGRPNGPRGVWFTVAGRSLSEFTRFRERNLRDSEVVSRRVSLTLCLYNSNENVRVRESKRDGWERTREGWIYTRIFVALSVLTFAPSSNVMLAVGCTIVQCIAISATGALCRRASNRIVAPCCIASCANSNVSYIVTATYVSTYTRKTNILPAACYTVLFRSEVRRD